MKPPISPKTPTWTLENERASAFMIRCTELNRVGFNSYLPFAKPLLGDTEITGPVRFE